MVMFGNVYTSKTVLVTGHTGFKGGWLITWLLKLGAHVIGYSNDVPTEPSLYASYENQPFDTVWGDIGDSEKLRDLIETRQPDFIFHLAAQPIVSVAYSDPYETFRTNVIGSVALLEAIRNSSCSPVTVFITSDKCYENVEWNWGYRENDRLGGKDPYSASKACAEIVARSYYLSFLAKDNLSFATARAGNVIGGGDWAKNRIVVDAINAWHNKETLQIRSPNATRPWQHVLEPLSGYLRLGEQLYSGTLTIGNNDLQSFNFGPNNDAIITVHEIISLLSASLKDITGTGIDFEVNQVNNFHEAGLLSLNCDIAKSQLGWMPNLTLSECVMFISEWNKRFYLNKERPSNVMLDQIIRYEEIANIRLQSWVK